MRAFSASTRMGLFEGIQTALDRLIYNNQDLIENRQPLKFTLITCDGAEGTPAYITAFNRVIGTMAKKDCISVQYRHIYWIDVAEWAQRWYKFCGKDYPIAGVYGAGIDPVMWSAYLRHYELPSFPTGQHPSTQVIEYTFLVNFKKYHFERNHERI